jgi:hypothetical protein
MLFPDQTISLSVAALTVGVGALRVPLTHPLEADRLSEETPQWRVLSSTTD